MYLQLAESGNTPATRKVSRYSPSDNDNPYIFVPNATGGGTFVREDLFDDLSDFEWRSLMAQLAPYQPDVQQGMSESSFMGDRASRKKRREDRARKKTEKDVQRKVKRELKNKMKEARIQAKKEGRGANILGSVMDTIGGFFGGGQAPPDTYAPDAGAGPPDDEETEPFYKNPIVIALGVTALAGGIYYFGFAKK